MGIPSFARVIVEKYKLTHSVVTKDTVEHFFIDFNCIVYNCYAKLDKSNFSKMRNYQIENKITSSVIKFLKHLIETVNPQKTVYIAVDGSAPCAKVQQQRFRRFKTIMMGKFQSQIKKKYNIDEEKSWNTSCNIAPGTPFMIKLSKAIEKHIRSGYYNNGRTLEFTLSDSRVPGEGEHKYMNLIRKLESEGSQDRIIVYSPDADVIVLSLASHKNNICLLRHASETDMTKRVYINEEFYYLHIDAIKNVFVKELIGKNNDYEVKRIITDYILLTTFAGNDFVVPIPYLKVKLDKLKTPMKIYKDLLPEYDDYLVIINPDTNEYSLNHNFFREFMYELSQTEEFRMKKIQKSIHLERKKTTLDSRSLENEDEMEPYQIEMSRLEHKPFYSRFNPLYSVYNKEFDKINYFQENWKENYYDYFFEQCNPELLNDVTVNYLESLLFVVNYYFKGEPSWSWHYKYRIAPLPSDVFQFVDSLEDVNSVIKFKKDKPFKPLQQLLLILPPQMAHILPKCFQRLMLRKDSPIKDLYPRDFQLDVYPGQKLIYTEPLLPEIDPDRVTAAAESVENQLSKTDMERNTNRDAPIVIVI